MRDEKQLEIIERVAMILDPDAFNPLPGHEHGKCHNCDSNRDEARSKSRTVIEAVHEHFLELIRPDYASSEFDGAIEYLENALK